MANSYRGNNYLKKKGVLFEWTLEKQEEYKKCKEDPIYFCRNYMKIVSLDDGIVPFELYSYQETMIDSFINNRMTIVATARQAGKTVAIVGFALHYILFNSDKNIGIIANKGDTARKILGRVQKAYELLPDWIQQGVLEWNKGSFILENGSGIFAGSTTSDSIRGSSLNVLLIDEAAFVSGWNEFYTSTFPVITQGKNTKVVLVSTPNGLNHFYSIWTNALEGKNNYNPIKVMWDEVPGRDQKWYDETLAGLNGDLEKFEQEFCVEFMGSSGTLINGATLKSLVQKNPLISKDGLTQFELAQSGHSYVISADVSEGKGQDYSAFHVLDITKMPYVQVCTYRNNMVTPLDYASIIHLTAKLYNNATILVENNSVGGQVANSLYYDFDCENIICTENAGAAGRRISSGFSSNTIERGVRMTTSVKRIGCSMLKLLVEQQQLIINDFHTIEELSRFSKKGNSYEAESGAHDDLVMGLVSFAWMSDQKYFREMTDISTLENLRDRTNEQIESEMIPFGFIETGHEDDYESVIDLTMNPRPEFANF